MKIEIDVEEITRIVRESLMEDYENIRSDDGDFPGLHDAIKVVLAYYTPSSEYDKWLENISE